MLLNSSVHGCAELTSFKSKATCLRPQALGRQCSPAASSSYTRAHDMCITLKTCQVQLSTQILSCSTRVCREITQHKGKARKATLVQPCSKQPTKPVSIPCAVSVKVPQNSSVHGCVEHTSTISKQPQSSPATNSRPNQGAYYV